MGGRPIYTGMPNGRSGPERIAHRGAPREFDENTLEGFMRAVSLGADAVELDVHLTIDGVVVVHHDHAIALAAGERAAVGGLTLAQMRACALPRGGRVPTLAEVMDGVGDSAMVYVELKGDGVGEAAVRVALDHGRRYAFHSFDHGAVLGLRDRWPDLRYGALLDAGTPAPAAAAAALPVSDIWAHWSLVDEPLVAAVHGAGQRLLVWTVNDTERARRLTAIGVDGLCTDDVRLLASLTR